MGSKLAIFHRPVEVARPLKKSPPIFHRFPAFSSNLVQNVVLYDWRGIHRGFLSSFESGWHAILLLVGNASGD